jgi:hypothetical protein
MSNWRHRAWEWSDHTLPTQGDDHGESITQPGTAADLTNRVTVAAVKHGGNFLH